MATQPESLIHTVKEMATAIGRSETFVTDMKRAGFKFPATKSEAIDFLRTHGPPGKFRHQAVTRFEVYKPKE